MKTTKNHLQKKDMKIGRIIAVVVIIISMLIITAIPAMAADDSVTTSLKTFTNVLFNVIKVVGVGIGAFGLIKVGVTLLSHDPTQRLDGLLFFGVGLFVFFVKELLQLIGVKL